ncbi:RHS repeat-associated core domain-containing protein [Loktanella sp. Alg231-35]|uniref:RHS repeat-associated core domain-containing protein n=1 Tax=Loktanella sp. Alg231-35 TaxID=1922220 RepID=UPI000D562755|nr:RHS repeat-associated core domain-containing protein [Loktanella sp. Alg231-35]
MIFLKRFAVAVLAFSLATQAYSHDENVAEQFFSRSSISNFHANDVPAQCLINAKVNDPPSAQNTRVTAIEIFEHFSANGVRTGTDYTCHAAHDGFGSVTPPGTFSVGGDEYCDTDPSVHSTSTFGLGACMPEQITLQCDVEDKVGNPIYLATGQKSEAVTDWASPLDPRFNFTRFYRTDGFTSTNRSTDGWGQNWFSKWSQRIEVHGSSTRVVHLANGTILHFSGSGATPVSGDHNYTLALSVVVEGGRHVLSHGSGREDLYEDINADVSLLSEIRWPDGYAISINRDVNNRVSSVSDNRGQYAEFTWDETLNPSATVPVVSQIDIDTDYDGVAISTDVAIDLGYQVAGLFTNRLLMTSATVTDVSSSTVMTDKAFAYDNTVSSVSRDLLVGISDGRLGWTDASEVQVFAASVESSSDYDVALYPPSNVIDGLKWRGNFGSTNNGALEFFKLDMGSDKTLATVVVSNRDRRGRVGRRLNGAMIVLYDSADNELHRSAPITGAGDESVHTISTGAVANVRYVSLEHSNQYLHVSEIEVFELVPASIGTYNYSAFEYDSQYSTTKPRAITTSHFGAVDTHTVGMPVDTTNGFSITATNPLGKDTVYSFEEIAGQDRIVGVQGISTSSCLPSDTTMSYNANGRIIERIEKNGARTAITRDSIGRILTRTEDADGTAPRVTTYTWPTGDLRKPLSRVTSELSETFTYDADGLLTSYAQEDVLTGSPDFGEVRTWTYTYTALASGLKVLTSLDGPGLVADGVTDVTTFTYNARGQVLTATDPKGLMQEVLAYGPSGQPTSIRDHQGFEWALTYDLEGQLVQSVFEPTGVNDVTTYSYDIIGQMTSSTDALGRIWDYTYDEAKRLIEIEAPSGEAITFDHDAMGNVTETEYRDTGAVATYLAQTQYDELGRILQSLGSNGQSTAFSHDVEDNLATVTDATSLTTTMSYDALNRMTDLVDRASGTTTMDHDESDQLTSYTDPRSIATSFAYNGFGELVSEVSADRGTMSYSYNRRGLATSMTDGRGTVANYTYDDGGRLLSKSFPSDAALDQVFTYHNDPLQPQNIGTLASVTDESGRSDYSNGTARGAFLEDLRTLDGIAYSTSYQSDAVGQITEVDYPSGSQALLSYDTDGDLSGVQWRAYDPLTSTYGPPVDVVSGLTYLPMGPMSAMTYGDGGTLTATHDSSYRLTGLLDVRSGTTLRDETYSWTNRDNLGAVTDNLTPAQNETFGYSPREFLSSADGAWGELDWLYDGVGNRTQQMSFAGGSTTTDTYTYPTTSNRLDQIAFSAGGTRTLTYDAAGNVTFDNRNGPGYGYNYDAANRMSSFAINGVIQAEYDYNALGQQVIRRLTQAGQTIHSIHDRDGNRIAEYDYDETAGTSSLIREYIWANGTVVGVYENGTLYFVRTDHIGRPVFAIDGAGTKVWEASYLPFGGVQASTGPNSELRFPGQWFQAEAGLHQNWMRDYDPTTGRYMQADPLGLVDGASVYGYALQNPGRYIDPRGEFAIPLVPLALGGAAFIWCYFYCEKPVNDFIDACGMLIDDLFKPPIISPSSRPPGYLPGDVGAIAWGGLNGVGPRDAKNKFHGIKQHTPDSRGDDDYAVNPDTGDVIDQDGESVGNLFDED